MIVEELIKWVTHFILDAANDHSAVRRIARISAYTKLKKLLSMQPDNTDITNSLIDTLLISDHMKKKLNDIILLGPAPNSSILGQLAAIHGLGIPKAKLLIKAGVKDVSDLNNEPYYSSLPIETQTWIKFKPLDKIPRNLICSLEKKIDSILHIPHIIAGSYRRGNQMSSDVDLLVSYDGPIDDVLIQLKKLNLIVYAQGKEKVSALTKWKGKYLKMDIMKSVNAVYPYFMLYLTGSKNNNIMMRAVAKRKGLLLNQNGLYKDNKFIPLSSEKEIFKYLGIVYKEPVNR